MRTCNSLRSAHILNTITIPAAHSMDINSTHSLSRSIHIYIYASHGVAFVTLASSCLFFALRWRSTGLQHPLHQIQLDAREGLILRHTKKCHQVAVAQMRRQRVSLVVQRPLKLGRVWVARAHVLALQMLPVPTERRVDVVLVHCNC
jgi:hypothetical protein